MTKKNPAPSPGATRATQSPSPAKHTAKPAIAPSSKIAIITSLLSRKDGATLTELMTATGWQSHSVRAALTGLRKKGHEVVRTMRDGVTHYHIQASA
jgi:hypothetical protein